MLGGLISALIVGAILENGDLYAKIAAESYIQSGDDAEFWKNLSEEEKNMAASMLTKIKEAKEGTTTGAVSSSNSNSSTSSSGGEADLSKAVFETIKKETAEKAGTVPVTLPKREQPRKEAAQATNDVFKDYD
jgi:hypothetical protein